MSMRSENYALWKIFNFWGKNVIFEKFGGKSVILKNLLHQNFEKIWKFHFKTWISQRECMVEKVGQVDG